MAKVYVVEYGDRWETYGILGVAASPEQAAGMIQDDQFRRNLLPMLGETRPGVWTDTNDNEWEVKEFELRGELQP